MATPPDVDAFYVPIDDDRFASFLRQFAPVGVVGDGVLDEAAFDRRHRAALLRHLRHPIAGVHFQFVGQALDVVESRLRGALELDKGRGDKRGIANSLVNLGFVAWEQGDHDQARSLYEESLPIYRELGDKRGIANALINLGLVAWEQNDLDEALALFKESLVRHKDLEDRHVDTLGWDGAQQAHEVLDAAIHAAQATRE